MIRNRLLYGITLISVTLFYGFFYGWFSEFLWYLVLTFPLVSLLISLSAILTTTAELDSPAFVQRQQQTGAAIRLHCKFPAPRCKFRIELLHTPSGKILRRKFRTFTSHQGTCPLPTAHSGAIHYRLHRTWIFDYLGLFAFPCRLTLHGSTLVLPQSTPPETMPGISRLLNAALRPKPGGGYAEIHELREYRPGDSLRNIHWKLTAKTDNPVVREPQELCLGKLVLSLDLPQNPDDFDLVLDHTLWLSDWLCQQSFAHKVVWFSGETAAQVTVTDKNDLPHLTRQLCLSKPTAQEYSAHTLAADAAWRFHVAPKATKSDTEEETAP